MLKLVQLLIKLTGIFRFPLAKDEQARDRFFRTIWYHPNGGPDRFGQFIPLLWEQQSEPTKDEFRKFCYNSIGWKAWLRLRATLYEIETLERTKRHFRKHGNGKSRTNW